MRALASIFLAIVAAGCVTGDERAAPGDAIAALEDAAVRACPPDRVQANARSEGFGPNQGAVAEDVAFTPLVHDPGRAVRLRRITVAPGGVIAWHDHVALQGMALIVSGEMMELRNTCLDPILYRAGDVAIEDVNTAHSWRNEGDETAVILVTHVVSQPPG